MDSDTLEALFEALDQLEALDPATAEQSWFKLLERHAEALALPVGRRAMEITLH